MDNKDKEIIKKLLKIASNQQKIIQKLAQSADPFYHEIDKSDPNAAAYEHDPLYSPKEWNDAPAKPVSVSPDLQSKYGPGAVAPASSLPANVKQMLDTGAPGLKNSLMLSLDGSKTMYRSDMVKMTPSQVKSLLTSALPGYNIGEVVGMDNPQKDTWHPNY